MILISGELYCFAKTYFTIFVHYSFLSPILWDVLFSTFHKGKLLVSPAAKVLHKFCWSTTLLHQVRGGSHVPYSQQRLWRGQALSFCRLHFRHAPKTLDLCTLGRKKLLGTKTGIWRVGKGGEAEIGGGDGHKSETYMFHFLKLSHVCLCLKPNATSLLTTFQLDEYKSNEVCSCTRRHCFSTDTDGLTS